MTTTAAIKVCVGVIVLLALALILSLTRVYYLKAQLAECKGTYAEFVAKVEVLGEQAAAEAEKQVAKNKQDVKEVKDGYHKARNIVSTKSADAKLRYTESPGSGITPTEASSSSGTLDTPEGTLPSTERIITDCREDVLKLVWLQHFELLQGETP